MLLVWLYAKIDGAEIIKKGRISKTKPRRTHRVPMGRHSRAADALEAHTRHALNGRVDGLLI